MRILLALSMIALIGVSMSAQKSLAKNTTSTDFLNPYLECSNCEFENLFQIELMLPTSIISFLEKIVNDN